MRALLTILVIAATWLSPDIARSATDDLLLGYWPLNGSGSDAALRGYTLTIYGGAAFAPGLFGQALDLHGIPAQYAGRPGDDSVFDFGTREFTVQAWVRYNVVSREQVLVEKFEGSDGPGWTLTSLLGGSDDPFGQAHFYAIEGGAALYSETSLNLRTGVWHQFIARRSGARFDLFVNAALVDSVTNTAPVTDTAFPLLLGRRNSADGRPFALDGRLDEVAVWGRALTHGEIAALYNGGAGMPVLAPEPSRTGALVLGVVAGFSRRRRIGRRRSPR